MTKAMVFPSGDHTGWRSASLSLVRRRRSVPSTLMVKRSEIPPSSPVKTRRSPSGLQAGVDTPESGTVIWRTSLLRRGSTIRMSSFPPRLAAKARYLPSADQLAEDESQR